MHGAWLRSAAEVCVCGYLQAMVDSRLIRPVNDIDQMVRNLHHAGDLEKKGEGFMDGWSERCTTPRSNRVATEL